MTAQKHNFISSEIRVPTKNYSSRKDDYSKTRLDTEEVSPGEQRTGALAFAA